MAETTATTGGSVLRGGFWYTASRVVPQLYTLAISIVAARFLGPTGMGRQSFIAFVELSLVALLSYGIFFALMRWVGESVGRGTTAALGGVLRWAWAAKRSRFAPVPFSIRFWVAIRVSDLGRDSANISDDRTVQALLQTLERPWA